MSGVLWVQTKKSGNILLPWPRYYMNSVTVQKIVKWKYGTSWVTQWIYLKWSTSVVPLCHLLATCIITCVWPQSFTLGLVHSHHARP